MCGYICIIMQLARVRRPTGSLMSKLRGFQLVTGINQDGKIEGNKRLLNGQWGANEL